MAEEEDKEILTTGQITFLAEAITPQNLKTIAMGYLDIDDTRITMEEYQHRLNVPAFKREIIKIWKYKNSSGNQVKKLAGLLYRAADEKGLVDAFAVRDILGVAEKSSAPDIKETSDDELMTLAEELRPFIEATVKMEMAPWVNAYTVDMDKLYTESKLEMIENTVWGEEYKPMKDYKELFKSVGVEGRKGMGKKVLVVGDPGNGKSTFAKKITRDWSLGKFIDVVLVFVVQLKLIDSGDSIEKIIIQQCPPLDGLKITKEKLGHILDNFGNKCLLIIDGMDEYDGKNEDVLKIIGYQKFYHLNVLVTSRPHCVGEMAKNGFTIVRVQGLSPSSSRSYAFNVLGNSDKVQNMLKFYSENLLDEDSSDTCPRLLLFLGTLVNKGELELSGRHKSLGEINMKLVGSIYRKFLSQKGVKSMDMDEFANVLVGVGKVALDMLKSGKAGLLKRNVICDAGPEAFEYGLLIGSEITDTLFPDETADITISFPYRSVQEFLGAFHFIQKLNDEESLESLLSGTDSDGSVLMMSPLFMYFCLWFLASSRQTLFKFEKKETVLESLKAHIHKRIDHIQVDIGDLEVVYPALTMGYAKNTKQEVGFNILEEVIAMCQNTKELTLRTGDDSSSLSLLSVGSRMPNLKSLTLGDPGTEVVTLCVQWLESSNPEDFNVVLHCQDNVDIDEILAHSMSIGKQASVQVIALREEQDLSEILKEDLRKLHITTGYLPSTVVAREGVMFCPYLTHLSFSNLDIDRSIVTALSGAARMNGMSALSKVNFSGCQGLKGRLSELFQVRWPSLIHINLYHCGVDMTDMNVLSITSSSDETDSTLPKLSSLVVSFDRIQAQQPSTTVTTLFQHPWPRLTQLSLYDVDPVSYPHLCKALSLRRLPNIGRLAVSMHETVEVEQFPVAPSISELTLHKCISSEESLRRLIENLLVRGLCKMDLSHSSVLARRLSRLVSLGFPSLNNLILSDCGLDNQDLSSLAQAEGNFPNLKHLNVSHNPATLDNLFEYPCKWNQLENLNIERTPSSNAAFDSLDCLAFKVRSGCLSSLEELRLSAGCNGFHTQAKNVQWTVLRKLYLCISNSDVVDTITPTVDAVNENQFPVLNTFCIVKEPRPSSQLDHKVNSSAKLAELKFKLQKRGISVYFLSNSGYPD